MSRARKIYSITYSCRALIITIIFLPLPAWGASICTLAKSGSSENLRLMINAGGEIGDVCEQGKTPLDVAVRSGNADAVKVLLDSNAPSKFPELLVYAAAALDHPLVIRELRRAGFNLQRRNQSGNTPIHIAARKGNVAAVRELLNLEVDPNLEGSLAMTPLHEAARFGNIDILRVLIEWGANLNAVDTEGRTAAKLAADAGHLEAVNVLSLQNQY